MRIKEPLKIFSHVTPEMYDELLEKVGSRMTKRYSSWRTPLEPGLKLALTLRHLAFGSSNSAM